MSVLSWAVLGVVSEFDDLGIVRICVAAINAVVGSLFLLRSRLRSDGGWKSVAVSLPSFLISGLAFKLSRGHQPWSRVEEVLFAVFTVVVVVSLITLGRNFAVFPSMRSVVRSGPFRIVRHPIYLGEWLLVVVCCVAYPHWALMALPLVLIPLLACRILAEEKLLSRNPRYAEYRKQVKWRLIPGVW